MMLGGKQIRASYHSWLTFCFLWSELIIDICFDPHKQKSGRVEVSSEMFMTSISIITVIFLASWSTLPLSSTSLSSPSSWPPDQRQHHSETSWSDLLISINMHQSETSWSGLMLPMVPPIMSQVTQPGQKGARDIRKSTFRFSTLKKAKYSPPQSIIASVYFEHVSQKDSTIFTKFSSWLCSEHWEAPLNNSTQTKSN